MKNPRQLSSFPVGMLTLELHVDPFGHSLTYVTYDTNTLEVYNVKLDGNSPPTFLHSIGPKISYYVLFSV